MFFSSPKKSYKVTYFKNGEERLTSYHEVPKDKRPRVPVCKECLLQLYHVTVEDSGPNHRDIGLYLSDTTDTLIERVEMIQTLVRHRESQRGITAWLKRTFCPDRWAAELAAARSEGHQDFPVHWRPKSRFRFRSAKDKALVRQHHRMLHSDPLLGEKAMFVV
ncbi:hypothetical protein ACLX1H_005208 [Fusarium chlamydosporum]